MTEELLSVPKAGKLMGISAYRANLMVDNMQIPYQMLGKNRVIKRADVEAYLTGKPTEDYRIPGLGIDYQEVAKAIKRGRNSRVNLISPLRTGLLDSETRDHAIQARLMYIDGLTDILTMGIQEADQYWFSIETYEVIGRGLEGWSVVLAAPEPDGTGVGVFPLHWALLNTLRSVHTLEEVRELHNTGGTKPVPATATLSDSATFSGAL